MTEQEKLDQEKSELVADLVATQTVMDEVWRYHPDNPDKKDVIKEYNILKQIKTNIEEELDKLGKQYIFIIKHNYVHLDVKFENIIISKIKPIKIKIIDLAFCKKLDKKNHLPNVIGTKGYVSPEVLMYKRYFHNTDVWSLGVVLYGLLTDKPLLSDTKNFLTMLQELQKFEISDISSDLDKLDSSASDLITSMLQKNPASRITLKNILKHKFINNS